MKKIIVFSIIFISSTFFLSCARDAKQTVETDNSNFNVELLFEKDGCKIYRFRDAGHLIYWSNCKGSNEYNTGGKYDQKVQTLNN